MHAARCSIRWCARGPMSMSPWARSSMSRASGRQSIFSSARKRSGTRSPTICRSTRSLRIADSASRVAPHRDGNAKPDQFALQPSHAPDAACTLSGHQASCRPWLQLRKGRAEWNSQPSSLPPCGPATTRSDQHEARLFGGPSHHFQTRFLKPRPLLRFA